MAQFHFVEDYEKLVSDLIAAHPIDEAMAMAVGGNFELIGDIERNLLVHMGLRDGMSLIDLGCGSGRLSSAVGKSLRIEYLGLDIVQSLLDYAATKSPSNYRFTLNRNISFPSGDSSVDMICAFSVFTHLLHEETFLYLEAAKRVLVPNGKFIFSFLEFSDPAHWVAFQGAIDGHRVNARPHLNMFIDRTAIHIWAERLGYHVDAFIDGKAAPWGGQPIWQASVALRSIN